MAVYLANDTDLASVAGAIREKSGRTDGLTFPDEFVGAVQEIPEPVPAGKNIKYIIPATYTPPRTADGLGFDSTIFTFTRENTNQLFYVLWRLQDAVDFTTPGYWVSSIIWDLIPQGNYNAQYTLFVSVQGGGKAGNLSPNYKVTNMSKSALSKDVSLDKQVGSSESYARNGQLYKGLIVITDSTYTGKPIVDEEKLSQFFSNTTHLSAGW